MSEANCNNRLVKFDLEYGGTLAVNVGNVLAVYPVKSKGGLADFDRCEIWFAGDDHVTVTNSLDDVISKFNTKDNHE